MLVFDWSPAARRTGSPYHLPWVGSRRMTSLAEPASTSGPRPGCWLPLLRGGLVVAPIVHLHALFF